MLLIHRDLPMDRKSFNSAAAKLLNGMKVLISCSRRWFAGV
jgi:hypothetical protein